MTNSITTLLGVAFAAGLNVYATVLALAAMHRFDIIHLPASMTPLASTPVMIAAGMLYAVEFVADKIQVVDSIWDVIHTFIRIPAGAVIAATAFGDFDLSIQVIALLVCGGLAASSHGTKAATRALINTSPEPFSNIAASVVEDVLVVVSILVAAFLPVLVFVLIGAGLAFSIWILPRVIRFFRQVGRRIRRLFNPAPA